jgi:hypothetical protein
MPTLDTTIITDATEKPSSSAFLAQVTLFMMFSFSLIESSLHSTPVFDLLTTLINMFNNNHPT